MGFERIAKNKKMMAAATVGLALLLLAIALLIGVYISTHHISRKTTFKTTDIDASLTINYYRKPFGSRMAWLVAKRYIFQTNIDPNTYSSVLFYGGNPPESNGAMILFKHPADGSPTSTFGQTAFYLLGEEVSQHTYRENHGEKYEPPDWIQTYVKNMEDGDIQEFRKHLAEIPAPTPSPSATPSISPSRTPPPSPASPSPRTRSANHFAPGQTLAASPRANTSHTWVTPAAMSWRSRAIII